MRLSAVRSRLALVTIAAMLATLAVVAAPSEGAAREEARAPKIDL